LPQWYAPGTVGGAIAIAIAIAIAMGGDARLFYCFDKEG